MQSASSSALFSLGNNSFSPFRADNGFVRTHAGSRGLSRGPGIGPIDYDNHYTIRGKLIFTNLGLASIIVVSVRAEPTLYAPACRNWQTRQTQNLLSARACGFESHRRHCVRVTGRWLFFVCLSRGPGAPDGGCEPLRGTPGFAAAVPRRAPRRRGFALPPVTASPPRGAYAPAYSLSISDSWSSAGVSRMNLATKGIQVSVVSISENICAL